MKIAFLLDPSSQISKQNLKDVYELDSEIIYIDNQNQEIKINSSDNNNLVEILKNSKKIFTSMPAIGNVINKLDHLTKKYDLVIGICLSKYLSNTFQSWKMIEENYNNKFWVMDVDDIEIGLVWTVKYIQENINRFKNQKELQILLDKRKDKILNFITLTNLDSLLKSGRVSPFKASLIEAIKLKIIIGLSKEKGKLDLVEKKFTYRSVINFFKKQAILKNNNLNLKIKSIGFLSTFKDKNMEDKILNKIKKGFNFENIEHSQISLLVASHTGLNAFGFYLEME